MMLRSAEGGNWQCRTLRVAKVGDITLNPLPSERTSAGGERVWHPFIYLDRLQGERLARLLGIHTHRRADAWNVIEYVAHAVHNGVKPSPGDCAAIETMVKTDDIVTRILACVEGAALPAHRTTTEHQVQFTHAAQCRGMFPREVADMRIDQLTRKLAGRPRPVAKSRDVVRSYAVLRALSAALGVKRVHASIEAGAIRGTLRLPTQPPACCET